jgi:hypothetical protein
MRPKAEKTNASAFAFSALGLIAVLGTIRAKNA